MTYCNRIKGKWVNEGKMLSPIKSQLEMFWNRSDVIFVRAVEKSKITEVIDLYLLPKIIKADYTYFPF